MIDFENSIVMIGGVGAGYSNVVVYPVLDQKVGIAANDARRNFLLKGGKEKYSFTEQENNDVDYIIASGVIAPMHQLVYYAY